MGQLSAFVYRLSCAKAASAWLGVKLNGPVGSVMIFVQFCIATISPVNDTVSLRLSVRLGWGEVHARTMPRRIPRP